MGVVRVGVARQQPAHHRMDTRAAGRSRHRLPADLRRQRQEGQPVGHPARTRRRDPCRRLGVVRPYRCRAGGRPALDHRSVQGPGDWRQALWPGRDRHEELWRHRADDGARAAAPPSQAAAAPGLQLRRRGRLHWRAPPDRRHGGPRLPAGWLHRGRAHRHAGGDRPQGQACLPHLGARLRGAFVAHAAGRQRGRDCLRVCCPP